MITICTLFSTLTTKHRVYVKVASKQISDLKNSTAPPSFEIPGSATERRGSSFENHPGMLKYGILMVGRCMGVLKAMAMPLACMHVCNIYVKCYIVSTLV